MRCILLPAILALSLFGCRTAGEAPLSALVDVKVAVAREADVDVEVRAPGTVFAREQANIAPRLTAPVVALLASKGDTVAASQVLARLESRDLAAQRVEAAAALADAQASLEKARSGTLPTDIERARGEEATTAAALNQALKFYERRKELFAQGAIPERDLLMSETELAQARTTHDVARRALHLLENQSQERDLEIANSRVEAARGRLSFIDAQLSYADVRSPFAGVITEQFLFPGDMAKPDTPIFTVSDLSVAVARAQVPEANAGDVRRGEKCSLLSSDTSSSASTSEAAAQGTITVVNRAVDPVRRTVEVWCEIPNTAARIRAGVFGTVAIKTGTLNRAVVIPLSAVQIEEGGTRGSILVVDTSRKAKKRSVNTAPAAEGMVAVTEGLRAGETVVIEGGYGLEDGTEVRWPEDGKP
jgi:RND family efflux transporter MFP subunit